MNTTLSIEAIPSGANLYSIVQQEVDLGARALRDENAEMAVTMFQSALEKLTVDQPFYDHLVHNLLLSYKLMIKQLFNANDAASANAMLRSALNLEIRGEMASETEFLKTFAEAYQELGLLFFKHRNFNASLACCRKGISVYRTPGSQVNLINSLTSSDGRALLADFTNDLVREQLGRHIFIACVPKSGSTFLKNLLLALSGYRDAFMVSTPGQFEQELYLPTLLENAHLDTVTQQHCRASDANVQMMQAFEIKPVVLVRNVFDSVVSLLDFYDKGAYSNSYFRADYMSLREETRIDLIIDNFVPWYYQFVASWSLAEKQERLEVFWLNYEELMADKGAGIRNVLAFYGLGASLKGINQKISETESKKGKTRFNKGVSGRGEAILNEAQKTRIRRMARYFPSTDLGRLGI